MTAPIYILYISISGNTHAFIEELSDYAQQQHALNDNQPVIHAKEISDADAPERESHAYFAFVPTYLDGGNGIDNGVKELMTNSLGEYIAYDDNRTRCLGIVGSGNKNFNLQYCLTAKRYAHDYGFPFLDDYELRGTQSDVERIYATLVNTQNAHQEA
ncbi:flavoprotein NrdI [Lactobacillus selangorensis]|uniref:Flavoprotein NrdI n=1 Tax=Lactobacillus selangorensis TaxID=81857 RepID=A0A0R2FVX1_9LACO|nr:class Ib ribonucleoside-diphosphate reductase assembly flavoprotein NrdI [Lactobacillus selangorensis]KRN29028.1 flavoprotein NrdI [Lactobacillus selangorensis]KRN32562.1 flavoprotein NrdI [Lactobacillus selangorensis]